MVGAALAKFRQRAEAIELQAPFDPRSYFLYGLCGSALAVEAGIVFFTDFSFSGGPFGMLFPWVLWFIGTALIARRYGHPRVALVLEALCLPVAIGALVGAATFMLTAISGPFADEWLASMDRAIGFDWYGLFSQYQANPELIRWSRYAYGSLFLQLALVPLALVLVGKAERVWIFLTAYALAGAITAAIHPYFPAAGPYVYFGIIPEDIPTLYREFPWTTGPMIEAIRSGQLRDLTAAMGGLVSFPSFHAVAAVLYGWAGSGIPRLRYLIAPLNIAMWFATIISGSHYFIDVLAGTALAIACIFISTRIVRAS